MRLPASPSSGEIEQLLMVFNDRRDVWWVHRIEERHGARAWLGHKNFTSEDHSVPRRNRSGKRDGRGVRKSFKTNARFPLTRPTSLEMCYLTALHLHCVCMQWNGPTATPKFL